MKTNTWTTLENANNVKVMDDGENIIIKVKKSEDYGKTTNSKGVSNYSIVGNTRGMGYLPIGVGDIEIGLFVGHRITPRKNAPVAAPVTPAPTPEKALEQIIAEQVALAVAAALKTKSRK